MLWTPAQNRKSTSHARERNGIDGSGKNPTDELHSSHVGLPHIPQAPQLTENVN